MFAAIQTKSALAVAYANTHRDGRIPRGVRWGARDGSCHTFRAAVPRTLSAKKQVLCRAESKGEQADSWIKKWKKREVDRESGETSAQTPDPLAAEQKMVFQKQFERAKEYHYVYVQDFADDVVQIMFLRDTFESRGVELDVPQLSEGGESYTITTALAKLTAHLEGKKKVRLVGKQVGAIVAALYANQNPDPVASVFLMEPSFDLVVRAAALAGSEENYRTWQEDGVFDVEGKAVSFELIKDAKKHAPYPVVTQPAYVVHGAHDAVFPIDNALAWVRGASVKMRDGRLESSYSTPEGFLNEYAMERRLLQVDAGHGLEGCMQEVQAKVLEYWNLTGPSAPVVPKSLADLENLKPENFARGHGWNFEVYDQYLKDFEEERDADEKGKEEEK